jgi:hypothetical protein
MTVSCPVAGFHTSGVEPSGSTDAVSVNINFFAIFCY